MVNKVPTMYDVADSAGVSQKTVSRVFRSEPSVGEKTREKVLKAAAELHFTPNVAARRLATNQANAIGLVFEMPGVSTQTNSGFSAKVILAALNKCRQENYGLLIHSCNPGDPAEHSSLVGLITNGSVDGLVLMPPLADNLELLELLDAKRVKYVECFSSRSANELVPYVAANDYQGVIDLVGLLLDKGHRRIAYIKGRASHQSSVERYRGIESALSERGLVMDPKYIMQGDFTFESGIECGNNLLSLSPPPTAIIAFNDDIASGVMTAAHALGINVPNELSIAGFDDGGIASQLWPPLTTVRQPIGEIVSTAIDLLLKAIAGDTSPQMSILLPVQVVERASVGPAPDSAE